MKANKLAFEQRYSDDSGVMFGVRLNGNEIEFEANSGAITCFPVEEIDWLIRALSRINEELVK